MYDHQTPIGTVICHDTPDGIYYHINFYRSFLDRMENNASNETTTKGIQVKDRIKNGAVKIKNHVSRQRYAYLFAGLAALLLNGNMRNAKHFDAFMIENGIDPMKFWIDLDSFEES